MTNTVSEFSVLVNAHTSPLQYEVNVPFLTAALLFRKAMIFLYVAVTPGLMLQSITVVVNGKGSRYGVATSWPLYIKGTPFM